MEGEDPIMEVESIDAKKGRGKKLRYLVKWKGKKVRTYEPLSHLKGCEEMVKEFEAKHNSAKAKQKKKASLVQVAPPDHRVYVVDHRQCPSLLV